MAISRYEPWTLLSQLQKELERSMEPGRGENSVATAEWAPAVDIKEEKERFLLIADVPGVQPDAIDVSMEDGVLTIQGEKETEAKTEKDGYKRVERQYGSFYRRFTLPDTADAENISAKCNNGVLEISIPKKAALKPKKITVAS